MPQPSERASGATPAPVINPDLTLVAEPMLGGTFKPGTWAAFSVLLENHGPTIDGELRISSTIAESATFGRVIQLPSSAKQSHVLFGQMGPFNTRFTVALVVGGTTIASANVSATAAKDGALGVYVVAEQPQALVGPLGTSIHSITSTAPTITALAPEQLPPRAEAWSSVDLLVWQDVDTNRLDTDRLNALRTWLATGGNLVVVAGSTGSTRLGAFPVDLLPYQPTTTVNVPTADLTQFLGLLPDGATDVAALTGTLERGIELARSGDAVVAARSVFGQGSVAVMGIDPATAWLAASPAAAVLWTRTLPAKLKPAVVASSGGDDYIVSALNDLPAVHLPGLDVLLVLIVGYILFIGPVNYLILRRRDRREWAWVTMPVTILVFAVGIYLFGVQLRAANVVVNELAIVETASGTDRGLAQVYMGIYSPSRATFDIQVGGDTLMSAPVVGSADFGFGPGGGFNNPPVAQHVDVLLGDPATMRGYEVGFGALRAFRAQTSLQTPRVDTDLRLVAGRLEGTVTNSSDTTLSQVAVVYGSSVQVLGDLSPGQVHEVSFPVSTAVNSFEFGSELTSKLFDSAPPSDSDAVRSDAARRAIITHLSGGWNQFKGMPSQGPTFAYGPVVLAWKSGPALQVNLGSQADQVGEQLYVIRTRAAVSGHVIFLNSLIQHTTLEIDSSDGGDQGGGVYFMSRGTITAEHRAVGFDGTFHATALTIRITEGTVSAPGATGDTLPPLPAAEQPDSTAPLAADPRPDAVSTAPRIQLFERATGVWVEFEPANYSRTYVIAEPDRFVDESGAFRVRFVVRGTDQSADFAFASRIEGDVQ